MERNKYKLLILGAGAHGQVVKEIAEEMGFFSEVSFLDDNKDFAIGKISDLKDFENEYDYCIPAIGNNKIRTELLDEIKKHDFKIPVLIHPKSFIARTATIGTGTVIEIGAVINSNSTIGENCIIAAGAVIDHNIVIENNIQIDSGCTIRPGTTVSTGIRITLKDINEII